jgi:integration host factor subunit beta
MLKSELVQRISRQNPHLYPRDIEKIVSAILDEVVEALRRGDRVELRDFGVFSAKLRGPRQGRNPKTGVAVEIAKKAVPAFKTGKEMRARLNRETVRQTDSRPCIYPKKKGTGPSMTAGPLPMLVTAFTP